MPTPALSIPGSDARSFGSGERIGGLLHVLMDGDLAARLAALASRRGRHMRPFTPANRAASAHTLHENANPGRKKAVGAG